MTNHAGIDLGNNEVFLRELEPVASALYERHMDTAGRKNWYPHQVVPWSRGVDFPDDYEWKDDESKPALSEGLRSALYVNLLTEDNLPYYFQDLDRMFTEDGVWGTWSRRWTMEEGRHSTAIRGYLTVSRAVDPVWLEDGRIKQMSGGVVPEPGSALEGDIYVTLQELATRVAHRNTGEQLRSIDEAGYKVMQRVAGDENFHMLFYRDLATAAKEIDPSTFVTKLAKVVRFFKMPGIGIPGFADHTKNISQVGIYGATEFKERVVDPTINFWDIANLEGLKPEADKAREKMYKYLTGLTTKVIPEEQELREEYQANLAEAA